MTIGKPMMDSSDRKVILVASKRGLSKLASLAYVEEKLAHLKGVSPGIWGLGLATKKVLIKAIEKKYRDKPEDEVLSVVDDALDLGVSPVLFNPSDAVRMFKFGVGHTPSDGTVYVQHPIIPDAYINPADFSRTVSKEKEAAFRQLASALGAKKLTLINANVQTKRSIFGSSVSIPEAATQIGIKVEVDQSGSLVKKVYSEYGEPRRAPHIPPDLQPWVDMDPDLRTMARDRIEGHLLKNTITLEFKEGIGIGGEVAAKLAGRGFSITGSYSAICHSVWYFDVEYYPVKEEKEGVHLFS